MSGLCDDEPPEAPSSCKLEEVKKKNEGRKYLVAEGKCSCKFATDKIQIRSSNKLAAGGKKKEPQKGLAPGATGSR